MTKKLRDVVPHEYLGYDEERGHKFLDVVVVAENEGWKKRWPGKHRNVMHWWELENGYIVGWNENPSVGWSFPVIKK